MLHVPDGNTREQIAGVVRRRVHIPAERGLLIAPKAQEDRMDQGGIGGEIDTRRIDAREICEAHVLDDADDFKFSQLAVEVHVELKVLAQRVFIGPEKRRAWKH